MRAIVVTRRGPPSVLEVQQRPDPVPAADEVLVEVAAAGLNFADVAARQGLYPDAPPLPTVLGYEVAGTVLQAPDGCGLAEGDRVVGMTRFGGQATRAAVPATQLQPLPDGVSFEEAAALPVNYLTAHHMLHYVGNVQPGMRVLVHMAAGGVGTAALQLLAAVPDLTVFGTASASKHDYLAGLGCHHPIDYRTQSYVDTVRRLTDGEGVDFVLDPLGGADWRRSWKLLRPGGTMVAFGVSSLFAGSRLNPFRVAWQMAQMLFVTPLSAMDHNRGLIGVNMGHLWERQSILQPQLKRLVAMLHAGELKPHIHAVVPFEQAGDAHAMLENRLNKGKVVLVPGDA